VSVVLPLSLDTEVVSVLVFVAVLVLPEAMLEPFCLLTVVGSAVLVLSVVLLLVVLETELLPTAVPAEPVPLFVAVAAKAPPVPATNAATARMTIRRVFMMFSFSGLTAQ
jgi:hypothetical protein